MIKTCRQCGQTYEPAEAFFRSNLKLGNSRYLKSVCIGCELSARTEAKQRNRPKEKARRAWHSHADKYVKQGLADSRADFAQRYGWDLDQMAHDIAHAAENGCAYCHRPFAEMGHGWADISLDIVNQELPPYYETNTRWVCITCNREKQKTAPDLWGAKLQCWKQWREWQDKTKSDPWVGYPLFEGLSEGER